MVLLCSHKGKPHLAFSLSFRPPSWRFGLMWFTNGKRWAVWREFAFFNFPRNSFGSQCTNPSDRTVVTSWNNTATNVVGLGCHAARLNTGCVERNGPDFSVEWVIVEVITSAVDRYFQRGPAAKVTSKSSTSEAHS
jgi:hypothetical protein